MKKVLIFSIALMALSCMAVKAQEQTDECMLYLSYYQSYYKQGTKEARMEALRSWRKAYEICRPGVRQNLYIHGGALYRMLIANNSKNTEYVAALTDTLLNIDRLRIEHYGSNPKFTKSCYDNYSADITNYILGTDPEKGYNLLSEIIKERGAEASPLTYVAQMNAAISLYKEGKIGAEDVIECYNVAETSFAEIEKADTTADTKDMHNSLQSLFVNSKVASCENLIAIFEPRFEGVKDDYTQVSKIAKLLGSADDCTNNDLFLKAVTAMHTLQPNASSAYYLSRLYAARGDYSKAVQLLDEASAAEEDKSELARNYYEQAVYYLNSGSYAKAAISATKAVSNDESYAGRGYIILAQSWMSMTCGGNEVESRAKFWVAADYFIKARTVDSSVSEAAGKGLAQCASYYPAAADAFMYDLQNGQTYEVVCGGMRATTTVRTK